MVPKQVDSKQLNQEAKIPDLCPKDSTAVTSIIKLGQSYSIVEYKAERDSEGIISFHFSERRRNKVVCLN